MAKCPKCRQRKAKRPCPALDESLCNLCCGQLREKEIDCPRDCPYLEKHKSYQTLRDTGKKAAPLPHSLSPEEDILRDERMAWLALHIEAPLKAVAERNTSFTDRDALHALEYALKKVQRGKRILVIDERATEPPDEMGEMIIQSMDRCRYEKKIILPDEHLVYSAEDRIKCLERILLAARYLSQDRSGGRQYIQALLDRFAQIKNHSLANTPDFVD